MRRKLVLILPVGAVCMPAEKFVLPAKLVDGVAAYVREWPGEVVAWVQRAVEPESHVDNRTWAACDLPCKFVVVDFQQLPAADDPEFDDAVVLAFPDHRLRRLAEGCSKRGVPYVVYTELTLRTQVLIAWHDQLEFLARLRRITWLMFNHLGTRSTVRNAAGIQCNGTPTYDAYHRLNANTLQYFDTRTTEDMVPNDAELTARIARRGIQKVPHLLFSGRLHVIKGVSDLVEVARRLHQSGVAFRMSIAGDGPLRDVIDAQIVAAGLCNIVSRVGVLDFREELSPLLRKDVDLFVCPHIQGDPSCTYLETMSAGVPVVGYANEALRGICRVSGAGWHVPVNRPDLLALEIARVIRDSELMQTHSFRARNFARQHLFEVEFRRRVAHMVRVSTDRSPAKWAAGNALPTVAAHGNDRTPRQGDA